MSGFDEVSDGLYVGSGYLVGASHVYAAQTYHYRQMGWTQKGAPPCRKDDPTYLSAAGDTWLTLNWVDGPARLFDWSAHLWPVVFDHIDYWRGQDGSVAIVCDQGKSRSPTLAMAYLAKRTKVLGLDAWFAEALAAFTDLYPYYVPKWDGIAGWVRDHWDTLDK